MNPDISLIIHLMKLHRWRGGEGDGGICDAHQAWKEETFSDFFSSFWIWFMYISQWSAVAEAFCLHTTSPEKLKKLQQ